MPMHDLARVGFELGFPSSGDNSARLRCDRPTDFDAFCLPRRRLASMNAAVTCVLARGVVVVPVTAPADLVRNRQEHQAEWADTL